MLEAPYPSALAGLDAHIEREIGRLRARYQLSLDEFRGLYVSDEHVNALLATGATSAEEESRSESSLSAGLAECERWSHLAATFELSPIEQDLLLVALAPELDLKYETLYAYLNDDVTRKWPTAGLAARLLTGLAANAAVLRALAPASTLRARRLIDAIDPPAGRPSLLNAGFALSGVVSRFVQGVLLRGCDAGGCAAEQSADRWFDLAFASAQIEQLRGVAALIERRNGHAPAIVITGPPGAGRMRAAQTIAREARVALHRVDLRGVRRSGTSISTAIADVSLEATLERAAVCVHGVAALADADGRVPAEMHAVLADVAAAPAPLFVLSAPNGPWRDLLGAHRALVVELGVPEYGEQLRLWERGLQQAGLSLPDADRRALADRFRFTSAQVSNAAATARDWLEIRGNNTAADLTLVRDAARTLSRAPLGSLATLGTATFGWDDLVLPATGLSRLKELAAAIRLRHIVYGDWGFARRLSGGAGAKALFAGPSGTGKTMAAGVIAREVGLDLVKVDLSGLVSKYIGDTEKNLDRVFASARAGNALLFFDEADAVFGKRSEVKDAHDRYANVEVAYLLQKMEDHDGVVLLATNLRRNIDEAFSRRLHYVIDFPQPDAPLRERLWRGMFPAEAPVSADVDFPFLARQFELVGGDIRNVVLDAAFLAADQEDAVGMRHIVRALARQMAKQGRSPSRTEFQRYFELLGDR